ncbi:hypothetical protein SCOR_00805 [Sulfidibacter corallicola]|uniref:Uncharacterized protein n=1 Tax=Sulfidibacter corallicola TaxID=2818388 RepID=A0A8A4TIB5_SULCO|nr:hypothetical protein [Sulfidibacter corallicola]QTD48934.1 hypothetical protein J3U87_25400 [Sulfidibacter corallicola]
MSSQGIVSGLKLSSLHGTWNDGNQFGTKIKLFNNSSNYTVDNYSLPLYMGDTKYNNSSQSGFTWTWSNIAILPYQESLSIGFEVFGTSILGHLISLYYGLDQTRIIYGCQSRYPDFSAYDTPFQAEPEKLEDTWENYTNAPYARFDTNSWSGSKPPKNVYLPYFQSDHFTLTMSRITAIHTKELTYRILPDGQLVVEPTYGSADEKTTSDHAISTDISIPIHKIKPVGLNPNRGGSGDPYGTLDFTFETEDSQSISFGIFQIAESQTSNYDVIVDDSNPFG